MILRRRSANARGAALILAILTAAIVSALAAALLVSTSTDTLIAGGYRAAHEALYAVEAGTERAVGELAAVPDWTAVLAVPPGNLTASFDGRTTLITAPDGRTLNAAALTIAQQQASDAAHGPTVFGADSPAWRLYARTRLDAVLPIALIAPPAAILIWLADDGGDGDGDPARDSNGRMLLHAEAYGVLGSRRGVDVTIERAGSAGVRILSWRDMR